MYARFEGHITVPQATEAFEAYTKHPDYAEGQKHLIDFSRVTSFAADYPKMLQFFANMDAGTPSTRTTSLFVYYAPTPLTRSMSQAAVKAWSNSTHIVVRVLDTEQTALDVLGLRYGSIADMLNDGAPADAGAMSG